MKVTRRGEMRTVLYGMFAAECSLSQRSSQKIVDVHAARQQAAAASHISRLPPEEIDDIIPE